MIVQHESSPRGRESRQQFRNNQSLAETRRLSNTTQTVSFASLIYLRSPASRMSDINNHHDNEQPPLTDTSHTTLALAKMDLLARLPLECLQSNLQTLAHQADVSALATLLRVTSTSHPSPSPISTATSFKAPFTRAKPKKATPALRPLWIVSFGCYFHTTAQHHQSTIAIFTRS